MKKLRVLLADPVRDLSLNGVKLIVLIFAFAQMASAAPRYVVKDNAGAAEPYDSWTNAADDIQTAINYAYAGETVWVSNGVYDAGGVIGYPSGTILTNRVAIYKAITVRSANNDPTNTIIKGAGPNGPAAVRCVYMTNGSSLIGFTLTNGATLTTNESAATDDRYGGGVWSQSTNTVISNCVLTGNSAVTHGGGAWYGTLFNCKLTGNSAGGSGGGACYATLYNCDLIGNSAASMGGGTYGSTLYNCTLTGNSAWRGCGVSGGTLYNCMLSYNSWTGCLRGGGANEATLYNCTLSYNSDKDGGGAYGGTLYNCTLVGNSATRYAGGAMSATLYNCTLVGNSGATLGGGTYGGTMHNCISWLNNIVDYLGTWYYSCAAGITGDGTITSDPLFIADGSEYGASHVAGNYRLSKGSPCMNTGTNFSWMTDPADARSKDLDGSPRIDYPFSSQVDMGCYEHLPAGIIFSIY